jgi:TctA family transporter
VPFAEMVVFVISHCSCILDGGNIALEIKNIMLNVPNTSSSVLSPLEGDQTAPVGKKRKFSTVVSSKTTSQKYVV